MGSMMTAQKNFRRLMQFFKGREDIEIITFHALMERYSKQKIEMSKRTLHDIALKTTDANNFVICEDFSPAEIFMGLVKSIGRYRREKFLPGIIKKIALLGPMERPNTKSEISMVTIEQVHQLVRETEAYVATYGRLPTNLSIDNHPIGTGSLFALFCNVYLDMYTGSVSRAYPVPEFDPYPRWNEDEIIQEIEGYKSWPVHRRDLDMSRIVEFTKLQFWTLKPAHSK